MKDPHYEWERACDRARDVVLKSKDFEMTSEFAIEAAKELLAVARQLAGIACESCGGLGEKTYTSTTGWARGIGGQAITISTCDVCWGSGSKKKCGPDLRKIRKACIERDTFHRQVESLKETMDDVILVLERARLKLDVNNEEETKR